MNGQLECHGCQEERKCQDHRPDTNNMEPLRVVDERFPILWWRIRLPGERGTVDRDGADDPDQDPGEHGEHSRSGVTAFSSFASPNHSSFRLSF